MNKHIILFGLIFLASVNFAVAEEADGGYAGAFLKVPVAARPAAMGGAYIALSEDAAGQLYNPGGLASIPRKDFFSSYRVMKLDRKLGFVSFVAPTKLQSALAISWMYAGSGEVEERTNSGFLTGSTIASADHVFSVTFAKQFQPFFSAGTRLNYFYKTYDDISANSIGIDLGAQLFVDSLFEYGAMEEFPINDIKIGLVAQNISAQYSWKVDVNQLSASPDDEFPLEFGLGVAFRSFQRNLLTAVDVRKNDKQAVYFRFGGEYYLNPKLALRAGLDDGHLTTGLGFNLPLSRNILIIDYAFADDRVGEGSDHIFSLNFLF